MLTKLKGIGSLFIFLCILFAFLVLLKKSVQEPGSGVIGYLSNLMHKNTSPSISETKPPDTLSQVRDKIINKVLTFEVRQDEIKVLRNPGNKPDEIHVTVPKGLPVEWIVWNIIEGISGTPYSVFDAFINKTARTCSVVFSSNGKQDKNIKLFISEGNRFFSNSARLALLFEDVKQISDSLVSEFISFPEPVTLGFYPIKENIPAISNAIALKKEIVYHIPFEPSIHQTLPLPTINNKNSEDRIRRVFSEFYRKAPPCAGFSNICQTPMLEDSQVMELVMGEISSYKGYFLFSRTGYNTVVMEYARKYAVPTVKAQYILENSEEKSVLESRFKEYILIAQKRGKLIVALPATRSMLEILRNNVALIKNNGIRMVYLSEIIRDANP